MTIFLSNSKGLASALLPLQQLQIKRASQALYKNRIALIAALKSQFDTMAASYKVLVNNSELSQQKKLPDVHVDISLEQIVGHHLIQLKEAVRKLHTCTVDASALEALLVNMQSALKEQHALLKKDYTAKQEEIESHQRDFNILIHGLVNRIPLLEYQEVVIPVLRRLVPASMHIPDITSDYAKNHNIVAQHAVLLRTCCFNKKTVVTQIKQTLTYWEVATPQLNKLVEAIVQCQVAIAHENAQNAEVQKSYHAEIVALQTRGASQRTALRIPVIRCAFLSAASLIGGVMISLLPELFIAGLIIASLAVLAGMLFLILYGLYHVGAYMSYDPQVLNTNLVINSESAAIKNPQFDKAWEIPESDVPKPESAQEANNLLDDAQSIENIITHFSAQTQKAIVDIQNNLPTALKNSLDNIQDTLFNWAKIPTAPQTTIDGISLFKPKS